MSCPWCENPLASHLVSNVPSSWNQLIAKKQRSQRKAKEPTNSHSNWAFKICEIFRSGFISSTLPVRFHGQGDIRTLTSRVLVTLSTIPQEVPSDLSQHNFCCKWLNMETWTLPYLFSTPAFSIPAILCSVCVGWVGVCLSICICLLLEWLDSPWQDQALPLFPMPLVAPLC